MATDTSAIRLLILDDSQNDAERLVSVLRNAGHATRAHRITSLEDLQESLQQTWDLCLALPETSAMTAAQACELIGAGRDIPVILLLPDANTEARTQALRAGMQDAIEAGADALLAMVVRRELANLQARRQRRIAEQSLRETEKRCQLLLDSSVDAIAYVHDGMHIYANRSYIQLFGYEDADELAAEPMVGLIAGKDQAAFKDFLRHYSDRGEQNEMRCSAQDAQGKTFPVVLTFSPASYDNEPCTQVVIRAETASAEFEEKLKVMARQDLVTGLFNRSYFQEQLETLSEQTVRTGQPHTLVYLAIDNFNALQADVGIGGADLVLADIAGILKRFFPEETLMSRFSDDACSVLLTNSEPDSLKAPLEKLRLQIEGNLFEASGRTVQITVSMGVAALSETTPDPTVVVDRAHRLADQLSQAGGNAIKLFNPLEELAHQANRGNLIALIRHSIETSAFKLEFQPITSLRGDTSELYEVFLRLLNSQGEEVPAGDYLQAAIEAGLAAELDKWMMATAVRMLGVKRQTHPHTRLLLNLNSGSLQELDLIPWISNLLKEARLPTDALVIQFNDADVNTYLRQAKAFTEALHQIHCKISLSHFGCALNPYAALKHLHVDYVKLDRTFSRDLSSDESVEALKSMVASMHSQGKLTIVPFVDSATMMPTLWQAGVNYIQGYYLQPPSEGMTYDFAAE